MIVAAHSTPSNRDATARRSHIERLFGRMIRCRQVVSRYESKAESFLGFARLACIIIPSCRLRDASY
jgi:transposase